VADDESTVDDEKLELLRSVLARAYEKRQPFPLKLIHALKDWMRASTQKKSIILSLQIEKKEDAA
jgi:hypothetical protein